MAKFTLKQIAAQSGLSLATIDRALHQRGNVHARTQHRIQQAIADLELMQKAGLAKGRTIYFDVIMHTPDRFQPLIREALSSQIASFAAFRLQLRFHFGANLTAEAINALLNKKALHSHGVILKVISTNICGSDQHMVRGRTTAMPGLVLGHEITGEVIEKGSDVEMLDVGDIVSVPFNVACGRCRC